MKGFSFKLEPLLKVKKVQKDQVVTELSRLLKLISNHSTEISLEQSRIGDVLRMFESGLVSISRISDIKVDISVIKNKKINIKSHEDEILNIKQKVQAVLNQVARIESEIKSIEKLKEKEKEKYKKILRKKEQNNLEERFQILSFYKN